MFSSSDNVTRLEFCEKMREYLTQLVPYKNALSEYIDVFCDLRLPPFYLVTQTSTTL